MLRLTLSRVALASMIAVAGLAPACAARGETGGEVAWQQFLGQGAFEYELEAMAGSGQGRVLIAASARPLGAVDLEANRLTLWLVSPEGEVVAQTETTRGRQLEGAEIQSLVAAHAVIAKPDGFLVLAEEAGGNAVLLRIGRTGEIEDLDRVALEASFTGMTELSGGNLLLFGHEDLNLLAVKVTEDGKVSQVLQEDLGKMDFVTDAVAWPSGSGGALLVASSGEYDYLFSGPSEVVLRKLDGSGRIVRQTRFPGSHGRAAVVTDELALVVFDRDPSLGQEIVVQAVGPQLEPLWQQTILKAEEGFAGFDVFHHDGVAMVAGAKERRPYVVALSNQGQVTSEWWFRESPSADGFHFVPSRGAVLFGGSVYRDTEGLDLVQRVFVGKGLLSSSSDSRGSER